MRAALVLFWLCLASLAAGTEHLPVRFWVDGTGLTWLTVYSPEEQRGKALVLEPDEARVAHFYFEKDPAGHFEGTGDTQGFEAFSPWWAKSMNIARAPDAPRDAFAADFYFAKGDPARVPALRVQLNLGEIHLRAVAEQVAIREEVTVTPEDVARWQAANPSADVHESPLAGSAMVRETVFGPVFRDGEWAGLAAPAEAWLAEHRWSTRVAQVAQRGPDDGMEKASPWEIEWDLQWARLSPDRATLLVHRRLFSRARRSALGLEVLNFRRGPEGEWVPHDPLPAFGTTEDIRAALRKGLNAQRADGDSFARQFPDLQASDGRRIFSVWDLGDTLVCVFREGHVAAPARGAIAVVLELADGPAAQTGQGEGAERSPTKATEPESAGDLPFVDVVR